MTHILRNIEAMWKRVRRVLDGLHAIERTKIAQVARPEMPNLTVEAG